jgi:hypothetical protein
VGISIGHVTMTASDAEVVVRAAGKFIRELNINNDGTPCEVTYRPQFGFGVFNRRRPFYVLVFLGLFLSF